MVNVVPQPAAEAVPVVANTDGSTREAVLVSPTQVRRPGRAVFRTTVQAFIALCALAPILVNELGLDPEQLPWLAVPLAVAATITRLMAAPRVEAFLRRFLPWLAAAPKS